MHTTYNEVWLYIYIYIIYIYIYHCGDLPATRRKEEGDSSGSSRYFKFFLFARYRTLVCSFWRPSVLPSRQPLLSPRLTAKTKPRQLEQSSYQTIAANYLIFRSSDDLPGAARPLSPAADVQTTPPPPQSHTMDEVDTYGVCNILLVRLVPNQRTVVVQFTRSQPKNITWSNERCY